MIALSFLLGVFVGFVALPGDGKGDPCDKALEPEIPKPFARLQFKLGIGTESGRGNLVFEINEDFPVRAGRVGVVSVLKGDLAYVTLEELFDAAQSFHAGRIARNELAEQTLKAGEEAK